MTEKYLRVIPRDLFNEATLLKCLGQLTLCIHDERCQHRNVGLVRFNLEVVHRAPKSGFRIAQNSSDGSIYCSNLMIRSHGIVLSIRCPLNSRGSYPLFVTAEGIEEFTEEDVDVFAYDSPAISQEFVWLLARIAVDK